LHIKSCYTHIMHGCAWTKSLGILTKKPRLALVASGSCQQITRKQLNSSQGCEIRQESPNQLSMVWIGVRGLRTLCTRYHVLSHCWDCEPACTYHCQAQMTTDMQIGSQSTHDSVSFISWSMSTMTRWQLESSHSCTEHCEVHQANWGQLLWEELEHKVCGSYRKAMK